MAGLLDIFGTSGVETMGLAEEVGALVALDTQVLALVVEKKARHPFLPSLFAE